jgi:hypothetical protein
VPLRQIARRFHLDKSSLHRHRKRGHCDRALRKAAARLEAGDGYNADSLIEPSTSLAKRSRPPISPLQSEPSERPATTFLSRPNSSASSRAACSRT